MNTESAVITAVCENKDISTVLADNIDEVFTSHRDVWEGLKSYYLKFKAVPDISVLTERFKDFEPVDGSPQPVAELDPAVYRPHSVPVVKLEALFVIPTPTLVILKAQAYICVPAGKTLRSTLVLVPKIVPLVEKFQPEGVVPFDPPVPTWVKSLSSVVYSA